MDEMLGGLFADAVFCAALFVESLALLSVFQSIAGLELPEELLPILNSYHAKTAPLAAIGGALFASKPPTWYADALLIAAVLFFSFFIAQARNAMAPYDDPLALPIAEASGLEAAIDFLLPAAVCAIGATLSAPTLLPFLTLPVAVWLLLKRLFGKPSWFKVSPSYYVNIMLLSAIGAAIFALTR
jgi:hypothetical protein